MAKVKISASNDELSSRLKELQTLSNGVYSDIIDNKLQTFMNWWKPVGHPIMEQELITILFDRVVIPHWTRFATITQDIIRRYAEAFAKALIETYDKPELLLNPLTGKRYADDVQYNNFHSIRICQIASIAVFLNDEKLLQWSYDHLLKQINDNLYDDGTSFDLYHRDSLGYHVYNIRALLKACLILQGHKRYSNMDLYNYVTKESNSIKNAIHYLFPFIKGERQHYMLLKSHFSSDKNSKNYGALWLKDDAKWLIHDASNIDEDAKKLFLQAWKK
jgi:hypothetical protein